MNWIYATGIWFFYKEIVNTDSYYYCGSNNVNTQLLQSVEKDVLNKKHIIEINIAPFSAMIFKLQKKKNK